MIKIIKTLKNIKQSDNFLNEINKVSCSMKKKEKKRYW